MEESRGSVRKKAQISHFHGAEAQIRRLEGLGVFLHSGVWERGLFVWVYFSNQTIRLLWIYMINIYVYM